MPKSKVNEHLIFLDLYSISINRILVTEFMNVKVLQNLNLMLKMSTQWNQQFSKYVFFKSNRIFEKSKQSDEYSYSKANLLKETVVCKANE